MRVRSKQVVTIDNYESLIARGLEDGTITVEQADQIREAQRLSQGVIDVDDFPREQVEPGYRRSYKARVLHFVDRNRGRKTAGVAAR